MLEYLIPIAVANLIAEQQIVRKIIVRWFKPEHYLNFSPTKRFIFDLLSCWTCLSVWTSVIYLILNAVSPNLQYIYVPLINMLVVDVIQKLKR